MHSDQLPITGPCPIDLDAIGFDRSAKVAHCTHCTKNVTVLSNMTRGEARAFLRANKGKKLCVSYAQDHQGRVRFREEPAAVVPIGRLTRRRPVAASAPAAVPVVALSRAPSRAPSRVPSRARGVGLAAAAVGLTAALAACTPHGEPPVERAVVVTKPERPEPPTIEPPPVESPTTHESPLEQLAPPKVPRAGMMVIPKIVEDEMVDGEMEVPDPDQLGVDEPCDGAQVPTPPTSPVAPHRHARRGGQE